VTTWTSTSGIFRRGPNRLRSISERAEPPVVYSRPRHGALSRHGGHTEPTDGKSGQAGEPVAAITPFHKKKQHNGRSCNGAKGGNPAATDRKASGLCSFHWKFGEDAYVCANPALGRETNALGVDQHCRPWPRRPNHGRVYTKAFSSGQGSCLLHFPLIFFWQAVQPSSEGCRWTTHSLLGRAPVVFHGHLFEWPILLARVQFPIIGVDFLRHLSCWGTLRQAETSAMVASAPTGRAATLRMHG
jgi:hypothetical protein